MQRTLLLFSALLFGCVSYSPKPIEEVPFLERAQESTQVSLLDESRAEEGGSVRWVRSHDVDERAVQDRWRAAVGPPLLSTPEAPDSEPTDTLVVVAWNTHVGGGSLDRLIQDLRDGGLTGQPTRHYLLLLQEVYRAGGGVPQPLPDDALSARRITTPPADGARRAIDEAASRESLYVYYVPSMRNGSESAPAEDRGNAILSTFPLSDPVAVELPFERERRVAIAAHVAGRTTTGAPWGLQVVSVHLDPRSRWTRFYRSFGRGRARQAAFLLGVLDGSRPAAVGGDLNTWVGGSRERAVRLLRERFPTPVRVPQQGTIRALLPDRRVDHLFFRIPQAWTAQYRVVDESYASDHRPLVGEIRFRGGEDQVLDEARRSTSR
jgi:endonuclease/exonuclease/phosphatase family metal-dependent hydrolase